MKFRAKLIIWISIDCLIISACTTPAIAPATSVGSTEQPAQNIIGSKTAQAAHFTPMLTASVTFTVNPIYTAIFRVSTLTKTPTTTSSPTVTGTPTRTLRPTLTPLPTATKRPSATPTPLPNFLPLINHVFNGVKVYAGDPKAFVFTIVGASEECPLLPSGRGIFVKYPDGQYEWKDRNELLQSGRFFVRDDDPGINSSKIDYLKCPSK